MASKLTNTFFINFLNYYLYNFLNFLDVKDGYKREKLQQQNHINIGIK
jgi:hypothetical protein